MKIAQVLYAGSWGEVTPETIEKGLGGRETAMIKLAEAWAKAGHEVTSFVNVEDSTRINGGVGYHEYVPIQIAKEYLGYSPWDAVVAWGGLPSIFNDSKINKNAKIKVCEMQVAHFPGKEMIAAGEHCDYVAALSDWHAGFMINSGLEMQKGKVVSLPNGVDMSRYPYDEYCAKRDSYKEKTNPSFVYSSSADRGLWHLLKSWPSVRKLYPDAQLFVCYGFNEYVSQMRWAHTRQGEMSVELEELIKQPGVTNTGKIGQAVLARLQHQADAWPYPLDALWPTETGCITAVENAAAGNPLLITAADCLEEEFGEFSWTIELPFNEGAFIYGLESILSQPEVYREMQEQGRSFAETRSWDLIGDKWLKLFGTDLS